jgi:hypothetical protein
VSPDEVILWKNGTTYPHNPVVDTDFNIANYAGEIGSLALSGWTIDQYNGIALTDLTVIVPGGRAQFIMLYSCDADDVDPNFNATYGITGQGSNGANPPKLDITYDLPPVIVDPADGRDKCSNLGHNVNWLFLSTAGGGVVQKMTEFLSDNN